MEIPITQYLRPNGRQRRQTTQIPDSLSGHYEKLQVAGVRIAAEVLITDEVSLTIEDPRFGDFDSELVPNGAQVLVALERLVGRFDLEDCQRWQKDRGDDG